MSPDLQDKVKSLDEMEAVSEQLKREGKRIVLCHGVYDLLHLGHIRHLNSAKKFGDVLVVSATADRHVKRGPGRPVFNQGLRAEALANLSTTDFICIADYPTAIEAIQRIRPDVYVKGPDYQNRRVDGSSRLADEENAVREVGGVLEYTDDITFSSSQLINNYFDILPEPTSRYLKELSTKYTINDVRDWFEKIKQLKVLIIGDTIVDQYHYCLPMGKSAKENIVANRYISEEDFAGGSLATANHVAQVAGEVELITVLGKKNTYEEFIRAQLDPKIQAHLLMRETGTTAVKRRYVHEEEKRKLFEIVYLDDTPLANKEEDDLFRMVEGKLEKADLVIVNDFGHGMLTRKLRGWISAQSPCLALNVQTNSANIGFNLVTNYPQAEFVCIDEMEIRLATRDKHGDVPSLVQKLYNGLGPKQIIVTRGQKGSLSYTKDQGLMEHPALATHGVDKIGAGDAFFAYTAPCFAVGMPQDLIGFVGNAVGSLKLQIIGNREPVRWSNLLKFMTRLLKF